MFIGVVRAKSFSQAAVEAGLTPQAVSKAVRQLEDHLGVRLFHRTTRSLSLTDEGTRLFELANPGLRLLDEALDAESQAGIQRVLDGYRRPHTVRFDHIVSRSAGQRRFVERQFGVLEVHADSIEEVDGASYTIGVQVADAPRN